VERLNRTFKEAAVKHSFDDTHHELKEDIVGEHHLDSLERL
jgi:hypothetical protein